MPVVDDLTEAIAKFGDALVYDLIKFSAEALWWIIKAVILMAWQVNSITSWLSETVFPPLVQTTGAGTQTAASMTFVIALVIAGLTYMLAIFVRLDVVNPRKAIVWFLAGLLFFQFAPQLYLSFHNMRETLGRAFFAAGLSGVDDASGNPFAAFSGISDSDPLIPYDLCDNYGPYFDPDPGNGGYYTTVRGTDVALAFLRANGHDIMGYPPPYSSPGGGYCGTPPFVQRELPQWWLENPWVLGGYFYEERDSSTFADYGPAGRRDSIENAFLGLRRLVASLPLVIMGVVDSLVALLLTVAEGLVFMSFGIALIFSYFNRTEVIALSVLDQMVQLIVQTVVIALMQSMIMGLTIAASSGTNPFLLLGMGSLSFVLMTILLWSGVKAVFSSINRLFQSISSVTGRSFITPTQAAVGTAGAAVGGALLAGGAGMLGMAAFGSAAGAMNGSDGQPTYASRALRGSGNMFRAGVYSAAAGTGNSRIAQLGHFSTMLHMAARDMAGPPPQQSSPNRTASTGSSSSPVSETSRQPVSPVGSPPVTANQAAGTETLVSQRTQVQKRPMLQTKTVPSTPPTVRPQPSDTATMMGQALERLKTAGPHPASGSLLQRGQMMAEALGIHPRHASLSASDQTSFIAASQFLSQSLKLGLSGQQAQAIVRQVQSTPDRQLSPAQRQTLTNFVGRRSPGADAESEVGRLLNAARALPTAWPGAGNTPAVNIQPQITVKPAVTLTPPTDVSSSAIHKNRSEEAALKGSSAITGQGD